MKKVCRAAGALFALVLMAGSLPLLGQLAPPGAPSPAAPADGPRIKFSETRFDFGKINSSTPVRHDYIVTNTGNAVLEITSVQPGCAGCTKALPWDRQIQPGKTGRVPFEFNPAGFSGTISKSLTVTCNDPVQPTHFLQFQAAIWQPIDVQPAYVYFMPVEGEATNETKIVRIVSNLNEPLTLQPPRSDNPGFKLELKTVQPGREFALHISSAPTSSNAIPHGLITIATSSTNVPVVKVTAVVMPQPALAVSPTQINLPAGPLTGGYRHTQMIRNNSSTPMKVTEAAVNADGVTVQVNESQPGKLFLLTVNFPPGFKPDPATPTSLTLKTSHAKRPIITVPISQSLAPRTFGARLPATTPPVSK